MKQLSNQNTPFNFLAAKKFNRKLYHLFLLSTSFLSSCKLDQLVYEPQTTPEAWNTIRPFVELGGIVLNEPLGSFLVFLLAFLWILSGFYFLQKQKVYIQFKKKRQKNNHGSLFNGTSCARRLPIRTHFSPL